MLISKEKLKERTSQMMDSAYNICAYTDEDKIDAFENGVEYAEEELKDLAIDFARYYLDDYRNRPGYKSDEDIWDNFLKQNKQ